MRTEKGNNSSNENNIKKMIIKRINENVNKNKFKISSPNKREIIYKNKRLNLSLNNNNNLNLENIEEKKINSFVNEINNNNCNNIFLEYNINSLKNKKTRNSIKYIQKQKENFISRLKHIKTSKINSDKKIILNKEYKKSKINNNDSILNINNKSFNEESIRTLYLNLDTNIDDKKLDNKNKDNTEKIYNYKTIERKIYFKNFLLKNIRKKEIENNSFFSNRNNKHHDNLWNLSTLEKTNRYNNSLFLNDTKNKISLNNTYKPMNTYFSNIQKNRNGISYNNKTLDNNKINIKNPSFIYIKNIIPHKIKHYSSKSQENIHDNKSKYSLLYNKKYYLVNNNRIRYLYYINKINEIVIIQKWWKDMIYRMYIEKKIKYIQKTYRKYLENKKNKFYINKVNEIILIQIKWRKYQKNKIYNKDKIKKLDYSNDDSYIKDFPKLIPFKLDNLEINTFSESCIDTIKSQKENTEKNNRLQKNIYIKKNIKNIHKLKKNNTVSNFFFSKYNIFPKSKIMNIIEKNNINFTINSSNKIINISENKKEYKLIKNISIEINKVHNKNNTNEIVFHIPINIRCFIEKRYENKIYKKNIIINKYYISKVIKNKYVLNKILFLQYYIKKYINNKNFFIKKPKLANNYMSKAKKITNLLGNSNRNQSNQSDIFSFNGSNFIEKINKDKINEKELYNLRNDKKFIYNNVNLFSFDNKDNITNINNEKMKKLFNKFFLFLFISNIKYIKFLYLIKNIINNHINKYILNSLKLYILCENQTKIENIEDNDEIDNILNNTKSIKNRILLEYKNLETNENKEQNLAIYIYNYFYNEKKFTNINMKLIKERLIKSPIKNKTQNNIYNYMHSLYNDILSNKICNICFCKFGERCNGNCLCHLNNNHQIQNKNGISIYRQKMNRIINDINNKKRLNNKININIIKNNDENENCENIEDNYNFKINYIKVKNEKNKNNNVINRYDTDSVNSRSRSISK